MFPSSAGIPIDLALTQTFTAQATASLDPSWELHNLEVVVFVQEDVQGEIFQTVKLRWDADCPVCGKTPTVTELIDYEQFCGIPSRDE